MRPNKNGNYLFCVLHHSSSAEEICPDSDLSDFHRVSLSWEVALLYDSVPRRIESLTPLIEIGQQRDNTGPFHQRSLIICEEEACFEIHIATTAIFA